MLTVAPIRLNALTEAQVNGPVLKLATPAHASFVIGSVGREKILVVLEIEDRSGDGIKTTDSGLPRFVEPNENAELFLNYVVERSAYTNHLGRTVTQIASLIPLHELKSNTKLTPPMDQKAILRTYKSIDAKAGFLIGAGDVIDGARFEFQVEDSDGGQSDRKAGGLVIGFASNLWVPPAGTKPIVPPETEEKKPH